MNLKANRLAPFNPKKASFGRHETFPLRFSWLTKGFQALLEQPDIFLREDATVALGVGKNMVLSIRYWMIASGITTPDGTPTEIGHAIFSEGGWDPYLEDEATIWLIHWLLASNPSCATSIYWFFNHFHKPQFSSIEVSSGLKDFVKEKLEVRAATNTLKHDVTLLLRMYVRSTGNKRVPLEDALDSPLSMLDLVKRMDEGKSFESKPEERWPLPLGVLGVAIAEVFELNKQSSIPMEVILRGDDSLPGVGSTFRLSEDCLITKLEELIAWMPGCYELRETAGINQLYKLKAMSPMSFLEAHYSQQTIGLAA